MKSAIGTHNAVFLLNDAFGIIGKKVKDTSYSHCQNTPQCNENKQKFCTVTYMDGVRVEFKQ